MQQTRRLPFSVTHREGLFFEEYLLRYELHGPVTGPESRHNVNCNFQRRRYTFSYTYLVEKPTTVSVCSCDLASGSEILAELPITGVQWNMDSH